ncbi:TetR/AcrR family transcriptional regulator [Salidesulfovibrio onnuriiensis]|uniref:TetR/AcrR family transcriptional regulator n=1 Tax=Salidesulfovibrio onnuriiensis TaxID=2583823 RepID=UPI0011CC871E|nr:TetR/AcrR family transcriptional regulator [Salidesulfovibrio onnuriiensis]
MSRNDMDTKTALLEAAVKVFAAKGFASATVREICQLANANVAAVNYHFGGKNTLYTAVLEHVIGRRTELFRQREYNGDASPEQRLEAYIRRKLHDIYVLDGTTGLASDHWSIFLMEVANPSENLNLLVEQYVQAAVEELRGIVAEMLEVAPVEQVVQDCALSIWGQLLDPLVMTPLTDRLSPPRARVQEDLERFADHMVKFTIGGLKAIRDS